MAGIVVLLACVSGVAARDEDACLGSDTAGFYPEKINGARDGSCILISRTRIRFLGAKKRARKRRTERSSAPRRQGAKPKVAKLLFILLGRTPQH